MSAELKAIFLEAAEKKGWLKEAEERKILEVAKELLDMGMSTDQIMRATKLPLAAIENLGRVRK